MVRLLVALLVAILTPALVQAQTAAFTCPPAEARGKPVALSAPLDEQTRLGLGYALMIAIASDDREWPHSRLNAGTPCAIGKFKVGDVEWALNAGGDAALPRWAQARSGAEIAFLARAPAIPDGYAFSQAAQKPMMMSLASPIYALIVERGHMRFVTRVYDDTPPANTLTADMSASLQGALAPIAVLDPDSGALSFIIATQSDHRAIIPGLPPGEGGKAAHLLSPDGNFFTQAPGGGVRMARSRFLCPASAAGFGLKDLWVGNATEDAHDLSCRFASASASAQGELSVSVTRRADHPPAKSVYDGNLGAVKNNSDIAAPASPALSAGAPPLPGFATAWTEKDGRRQSLWLAAIGDWYVEVLATCSPDASADVGKAVGQIYREAFREVSAR